MTVSPNPARAAHHLAAALFDDEAQARAALAELDRQALPAERIGLLIPRGNSADSSGLLLAAASPGDLRPVLLRLGLPEGEAHFYTEGATAGQTLVVVDAGADYESIRSLLLGSGGADIHTVGAALARPAGAGVVGGTGPRPADLTTRWQDVRSRYEMLWDQHYGTSDQTWPQMEPVYRFAWERANAPAYRGRPWSAVETLLEDEWRQAGTGAPWSAVVGPVRDVWEDVAAEAMTGTEGGAERRIPGPGTDQAGPARDLVPPAPRVP